MRAGALRGIGRHPLRQLILLLRLVKEVAPALLHVTHVDRFGMPGPPASCLPPDAGSVWGLAQLPQPSRRDEADRSAAHDDGASGAPLGGLCAGHA